VLETPYRWLILVVFMLISIAVEIQWLTHAAVVRPAAVFYNGQFKPASFFNIDFLANSYMLVFLFMSFPASYLIDRIGIRKSLVTSALMVGVFSLGKAIFAKSFVGVVVAQIGLATAQPLILNAITAVTVRWFQLAERALAAGLLALAQYLGILIAMLITPLIVGSNPELAGYGMGFEKMLWIYGGFSVIAALAVVIFMKEHPKGYLPSDEGFRPSFGTGIFQILRNRDMLLILLLFCFGLGIFNAISSMTDSISANSGVKDSDGLIGGLMLIGGIIGAVIIPLLSDYFRKRKLFLVICLAGMVPGVTGLSFAGNLGFDISTTYNVLLISSFILGFFVMSAGPIGFQYAAEISYPAPEPTSQGMLLWIGQLSGMLFVTGMSLKENQYLPQFLTAFTILTILSFVIVLFLHESPMMKTLKP